MNEQQIRKIVKEEMLKDYQSGSPRVSPHTHNKIDGLQITQSDITPGVRAVGSITFGRNITYSLGITFNPTSVMFYGSAVRLEYAFVVSLPTIYTFTITSGSASVNATYTNSGHTYTVKTSITGQTVLTTTGTANPAGSGTLTKTGGVGDATITYASFVITPNATPGTVFGNNGQTFTVNGTFSGGASLTAYGSGDPQASGTLTLQSGTGDSSITYTSFDTTPTIRAHVIGTAQLGPGFNFQPLTTSSVKAGPIQSIIQSSSMFLVDTSVLPVVCKAIASEFHLVEVEYKGTTPKIKARADVVGFSNKAILVQVSNLDTGWQIIGNYVVT